jgi:hypothetical protein
MHEEIGNTFKILVRKPEGTRSLGEKDADGRMTLK